MIWGNPYSKGINGENPLIIPSPPHPPSISARRECCSKASSLKTGFLSLSEGRKTHSTTEFLLKRSVSYWCTVVIHKFDFFLSYLMDWWCNFPYFSQEKFFRVFFCFSVQMLREMVCQLDSWHLCTVWRLTRLISLLMGGRCRLQIHQVKILYNTFIPFIHDWYRAYGIKRRMWHLPGFISSVYAQWHTCTLTTTAFANVWTARKQRGICLWIMQEEMEDTSMSLFLKAKGTRHYSWLCLTRRYCVV